DVGDDLRAFGAVVGVDPGLAVAVAAAHVGLGVDEAGVDEHLPERREAGPRLRFGAAVEVHHYRAGPRAILRLAHEDRDGRAVARRISLELRAHESCEIDLRRAAGVPAGELAGLPVEHEALLWLGAGVHGQHAEAAVGG